LNFRHALLDAAGRGVRVILLLQGFANNWRTQSIRLRLASRLSYGMVRFIVGMAGYAPGKQSGRV